MTPTNDTDNAPQLGGARKETSPRLGGEAALKHIIEMMYSEDEATREQAIERLEEIGSERACDLLMEALDDESYSVRNRAVVALGYLGNPRATEKLVSLFGLIDEAEIRILHEAGRFENLRVRLLNVVDAIGRIGDPRGLHVLTRQTQSKIGGQERGSGAEFWSSFISPPIRVSWAIASIAGRTDDPEVKQQAARQLVRVFPDSESQHEYILHRMPWTKADMLNTVASLLSDADADTRYCAAIFLSRYGDPRGADVLLRHVYQPDFTGISAQHTFGPALDALGAIGDQRALDSFLELIERPEPPPEVYRQINMLLRRWGEMLTPDQRERLTAVVPNMLAQFQERGVMFSSDRITAIRSIGTERARQFVDEWLAERIYSKFEAFIERGDSSVKLEGVSESFDRGYKSSVVRDHPLMRQYAFPALHARIEWLRAHYPDSEDPYLLIEDIGWLCDARALPFLVNELDRAEQDGAPGFAIEEIIYAIGNLFVPESVSVLIGLLQNEAWREYVVASLHNSIVNVPDERAILALLELYVADGEYSNWEVLRAIGYVSCSVAVPGLAHLLTRRDETCAEAINALAEIAKHNHKNLELVREIVSYLVPMLDVRQRVRLNMYQPLSSMPIDAFTALVLEDIGTPEALDAVARWKERNNPRQA